jgi:hypothetical protein
MVGVNMYENKSEAVGGSKDHRLSDDELDKVVGSEKLNLSIWHPIDSWKKVLGELAKPYVATWESLQSRNNRR